ncbi:MAG: DUF1501 domain-containing protein [Gemmataceae bacterium]
MAPPPVDRRHFLTTAAGVGPIALRWLLARDAVAGPAVNPLAPKPPHFPAKAKRCIFIFLVGGTSSIELFDRKPKLNELHGQKIPDSFVAGKRFAFTDPDKSYLLGCKFGFKKYGKCGMELSELIPHIGAHADDLCLIRTMNHTAFVHAPAELVTLTGRDATGLPTIGSWMTYGLGSESANLPAYAVLPGTHSPAVRSLAWGSGFLPSHHRGVVLRHDGPPILNVASPEGVTPSARRATLDAVAELNTMRHATTGDSETLSRMANYELAFRMQTAGPELTDLSGETRETLDLYGCNRLQDEGKFARVCLTARRLVERGVRFVSVIHHKWDHHEDLNEFYPSHVREVDQPIGGLLTDLKRRGLLNDTLVVWATEFGRTAITQNAKPGPRVGRDHHPFAYSMWMAGGGVKGGYVHGATDEIGWNITESPVPIHDFHATLLHLFGLDHLKLTYRHRGLDARLTDQAGNVVHELIA